MRGIWVIIAVVSTLLASHAINVHDWQKAAGYGLTSILLTVVIVGAEVRDHVTKEHEKTRQVLSGIQSESRIR